MKKMIVVCLLAAMAGIGMMASCAMATSLWFSGNYSMLNNAADSSLKTLQLAPGAISGTDPGNDVLMGGTVSIASLDFSKTGTSVNNGMAYDFVGTYADGFSLYDPLNSLVVSADMELDYLMVYGASGGFNYEWAVNLSNIEVGSGYQYGTSTLVDAFQDAVGGSLTVNFTTAGILENIIEGTGTCAGTYSGVAAPVPEPGVTFLFGVGVAGLAGVIRRRKAVV